MRARLALALAFLIALGGPKVLADWNMPGEFPRAPATRQMVPPSLITGAYTIQSGDCKRTVFATGGPYTITLPPPPQVIPQCDVNVCNGNPNDATHHAILLSGFPDPIFKRLYMGQCVEVNTVGGSGWSAISVPPKFRPAGFAPTIYVDTGGSSLNDGLISNASTNAVALPSQCFSILQVEMDLPLGSVATCSLTSGQTFTEAALTYSRGGTGSGVIYLIGNGGNATIRTSGSVVLQLNDTGGGYLILGNITLDCTAAGSHPCYALFSHQQNGSDLSAGAPANNSVTFIGANATDIGIYCDSMCKLNAALPLVFGGTLGTATWIDEGSVLNANGGTTLQASATITGNIYQITKGSILQHSGPMTFGASSSANQAFLANNLSQIILPTLTNSGSFSGRQWAILGGSIFCNGSATAVLGTAGINAATGYGNGTIIAQTSGNCTP